ncbi:phosphoribosyltransferase [Rhodococcus sp. HM1]|uniref:phosphoribosyltransferase n=1 Tax=unclassified Rhodococcus (in: high G+C Gram-positive bacteria) TaxID=192944 RepID=UPI0018CD0D88|nr:MULTISPECIES: phosphoribosyltransferase family protein [unclassified Rhodococcus (in: high G+C Gram-positive bacteria)]MBH0122735.1 phosphoribosyltransferase [Rhodococcus sp. CX]MCK8671843.1 phosphoribosyltransferase [Rhodococcus sp. HM1]
MRYASREEAGRRLARSVGHLRDAKPVILALPRGGIPVAREVARELDAPLDVLVVRKLGVPWQPELAMGAIAEGGARILNEEVLRRGRIGEDSLARVEYRERAELERRARLLRGDRARIPIAGRTVVLVDDGLATGATAAAACLAARAEGAERVVVAIPVASPEAVRRIRTVADEVVCPEQPTDQDSVGAAYEDFHQLTDSEATELLKPQ